MPQLYALLVGINNYHPKSGVPNLRGCINDVTVMQQYLTKTYKSLLPAAANIRVLTDAEATRENLLKVFQDHLCDTKKMKPGDIAFFYYSGHGSFEDTSPEFREYDSKEQNETMVLYDSRLSGKEDLADKEMAVLISRIPEAAQRIIMLDCCHSGSATRNADDYKNGLRRQQPARKKDQEGGAYFRPLTAYMLPGDNYYANLKKTGQKVLPPYSKHILLGACDRDQTALETSDHRGLFSKTMLDVLEKASNRISYVDLHVRVRAAIKNSATDQTPKIEPYEGFNANKRFLGDESLDSTSYLVKFNETRGQWEMQFGEVHGMPADPDAFGKIQLQLSLDLSSSVTAKLPALEASVSAVGITYSALDIFAVGDQTVELDPGMRFNATILNLPKENILFVELTGDDKGKKQFNALYTKDKSAYLEIQENINTKYELCAESDQLFIYHSASGQLIHGINGINAGAVQYIRGILERIEKWERFTNLERRAQVLDENQVEVKFYQTNALKGGKTISVFDEGSISLDFEKSGNDWQPVYYRVTAKNNSDRDLYVTLLFMSRKFDIGVKYASQIVKAGSSEISLHEYGLTISDPTINETTDIFKVILSTEEIETAFFTQGEIALGKVINSKDLMGNTRDALEETAAAEKREDWFTRTITVNLIRKSDAIGAKEVNYKTEGITIKGHPSFTAKIGFAPLNSYKRSVGEMGNMAGIFNSPEMGLMNFAPSGRGEAVPQDKTIIELSNIQNEASLKKTPLEITLNQPMKDNETVVAVTYADGVILPFGEVKKDANNCPQITIRKLPPPPSDGVQRSLGSALKFCFLKLVMKKEAEIFQLRYANYIDDKAELTDLGLNNKIAAAKKVLLVIHGIIGDTQGMADSVQFALAEKRYDVVLAFDYENLNTPIEKIAAQFKTKLEAAGFGPNDNKELHIVAHSMGGLVSRYLIEHLGGEAMVDRLIMFGTPNGGSAFGKAPDALNSLNWLLGLGLNFVPSAVSDIVKKITSVSTNVTVTLKQMDTGSDFIKELAKSKKPKTAYYVVAGNIKNYKNGVEGGWFSKLAEKLELGMGKLIYWGKPNDIAVSTANILNIPFLDSAPNTRTIVCHHLNYFVFEEGVKAMKEIL